MKKIKLKKKKYWTCPSCKEESSCVRYFQDVSVCGDYDIASGEYDKDDEIGNGECPQFECRECGFELGQKDLKKIGYL